MHEPLHITAFFDGSPGHNKQTDGVLRALQKLTPLSITHIKTPPLGLIGSVKDWLDYFKAAVVTPGRNKHGAVRVDLIIGTGTHTHIPMLVFKKAHPAKVVTCMKPGFPLLKKTDLCFIPQHDKVKLGKTDNIFLTVGPPVISGAKGVHAQQKGLLLIGGLDKKSHHWDLDLLRAQVYTILERKAFMQWTISSSPRTPDDTMLMLRKVAADNPNVTFFTSQETPAGWIEQVYAECQTVWVTADSISMVYEALSSGCSVGLLPVKWKRKNSKFQRSIIFLIETKRVITYQMWVAGHPMVQGTVLNEAQRCAKEILRRWWPDRLP
jgi:mitochondrial fission protein ELM1